MRMNQPAAAPNKFTHEGGKAWPHVKPLDQLRRSVLSCLLWEDTFYEDGEEIGKRIAREAEAVTAEQLAALAIEARSRFNLRHVPLVLLEALSRKGRGQKLVADTVFEVVQRADELAELLAILWKDGRKMIPHQVQKGLKRAFAKFDEYGLAKYDRDDAIKLRDALRMVRPKPINDEQSSLYKRIKERTLKTPDTWEVELSKGADKKATWERLLMEGKLGYLALLRNLRNMAKADVDPALVREAILARKGARRVLPFRYVAAARAMPGLEPAIDQALQATIAESPMLLGRTVVVVDVSSSMDVPLSSKSDLTRMDAAAALASIINAEDLRVFTFSNDAVEVASRRGMAGVDAVRNSQRHGGTYLAHSLTQIKRKVGRAPDRLIVITDEQSHDGIVSPDCPRAYLINVASYQNGVGYGDWVHIDGFSEQVLRFISELEVGGLEWR